MSASWVSPVTQAEPYPPAIYPYSPQSESSLVLSSKKEPRLPHPQIRVLRGDWMKIAEAPDCDAGDIANFIKEPISDNDTSQPA